MKRTFAVIVCVLMLTAILAAAGVAEGTEARTLREGKYIIGKDIPAGNYQLTCTGTEGEQMGGLMDGLGDMYGSIEGTEGFGSLFGAFGDIMEEYDLMLVEILGDYGDVLRSFEMKSGETCTILLEEETALQISDGSCTITAVQ